MKGCSRHACFEVGLSLRNDVFELGTMDGLFEGALDTNIANLPQSGKPTWYKVQDEPSVLAVEPPIEQLALVHCHIRAARTLSK
jgi:hypothetical protein